MNFLFLTKVLILGLILGSCSSVRERSVSSLSATQKALKRYYKEKALNQFWPLQKGLINQTRKLSKNITKKQYSSMTGSREKYLVHQRVTGRVCHISVFTEIKKRTKKRFLRKGKYEHLPKFDQKSSFRIDYSMKLYKEDFDEKKNLGHLIRFGNRPNLFLWFHRKNKKQRDEQFELLLNLRTACNLHKKRIMVLRKEYGMDPLNDLNEIGFPRRNGKHCSDYRERTENLGNYNAQWENNDCLKVPEGNAVYSFQESGLYGLNTKNADEVEVAMLGGQKTYVERMRSLKSAKKSIRILNLHYGADQMGIHMANELIRKRQNGVKIDIFIDALTPWLDIRDWRVRRNTYRMYKNLMLNGIPVYGYHCGKTSRQLLREYNYLRSSKPNKERTSFMQRFHEKIWLVDDRVAIIGGSNLTSHYHQVNEKGRGYWSDMDILIKSNSRTYRPTSGLGPSENSPTTWVPIISEYNNRIDDKIKGQEKYGDPKTQWCFNKFTPGTPKFNEFKDKYKPEEYVPPKDEEELLAEKKVTEKLAQLDEGLIDLEEVLYNKDSGEKEKKLKEGSVGKTPEELGPDDYEIKTKLTKVLYKPKLEKIKLGRSIFSRPIFEQERHIEDAYIELIEGAKVEILMVNSYLMLSRPILSALKFASERGVKIRLITNGEETNDPPIIMTPLARKNYLDLISNNYNSNNEVEIYEWDGYNPETERIEYGMTHAKYAIFDRKIVLVGSYNFDYVSRDYNSELAFIFEAPKLSREFTKYFYEDQLKFSKKVEFKDILDYENPRRFKDNFLLKFLKLFEKRL